MKTLCPQEYTGGGGMRAVPCTKCSSFSMKLKACTVETGSEHFPLVPEVEIPTCPLQDVCQHQVQRGTVPCPVRARGLVCESAFTATGMSESDAFNHPLAFNADCVASPEEWAEILAEEAAAKSG